MKPDKGKRAAALAYARKELAVILAHVAAIENELPAPELELAEVLERLEDLHAEEPPLDPDRQEELSLYRLGQAWHAGLAPSGYKPDVSPYVAEVESLIATATGNLVAYETLGFHSANLISNNHPMIPQLRTFVVEVLQGNRTRPSIRGAPRLHPSRDALFHALVGDIADRFGLTPTRNKGAVSGDSACDIVAEAMPYDARLPKKYGGIETIWLHGERMARTADAAPADRSPSAAET